MDAILTAFRVLITSSFLVLLVYWRLRVSRQSGPVILYALRPVARFWQLIASVWCLLCAGFIAGLAVGDESFALLGAIYSVELLCFGLFSQPQIGFPLAYAEFREHGLISEASAFCRWENIREYKWNGPNGATLVMFVKGYGWARFRLTPEQKPLVERILREKGVPPKEKTSDISPPAESVLN